MSAGVYGAELGQAVRRLRRANSVHRWREEIERRLGYRLHEHQAEIEVALRIENLRAHHATPQR